MSAIAGLPPNDDANSFDINDWLDAHDDEPAREELEPDYSTERSAP